MKHTLVWGKHTIEDLQKRFFKEGPFEMESLIGEPIKFDYDPVKKNMTIAGGDIFVGDIHGVDGLVHFSTEVPLPRSVTHNVYDMGKEDPKFSTQITYIDTVRLDSDIGRLLPLTGMYAPNSAWEGKRIFMESVGDEVIKSHMFKELMWCDALRGSVGTTLISTNEKKWKVTLNANNMPCFESLEVPPGEVVPRAACIVKCDILARNGIVHELDYPMFSEEAETRAPSAFAGNLPSAPSAPVTWPPSYPPPSPVAINPPTNGSVAQAVAYASAVVLTVLLLLMQ